MALNADKIITGDAGSIQGYANSINPKAGADGKALFMQTLSQYASIVAPQQPQSCAKSETIKGQMAQLAEKMRSDMLAMKLDMLTELMSKDDENPYLAMVDTQSKCIDIAMHVMRGDRVSVEDLRYLAKNNPSLYFQALLFRQEKDDPEIVKQISDDEAKSTHDTSSGEKASESASNPCGVYSL